MICLKSLLSWLITFLEINKKILLFGCSVIYIFPRLLRRPQWMLKRNKANVHISGKNSIYFGLNNIEGKKRNKYDFPSQLQFHFSCNKLTCSLLIYFIINIIFFFALRDNVTERKIANLRDAYLALTIIACFAMKISFATKRRYKAL